MIDRIVIFGAAGDLASRYLMPALASILATGELPESLSIVGVARRDWTDEQFRRHIGERLDRFAEQVDRRDRERLVERTSYLNADVTDADALQPAFETDGKPVLVYLALPPSILPATIDTLAKLGLPEGSRIVVEKPFGEGVQSAIELNRQLQHVFREDAIYRIDHFLGKQTVQNILGLRFANRIFEPVWNCHHVRQVEIIWDETLALEGRAGYYDSAGALKDMIQNHLLQLLCLIAMEPPSRLTARELRDRKLDVLRAVRRLAPDDLPQHTYRARYAAGAINGKAIPNYVDEEGVTAENQTETFAEVRLTIDNWRWGEVPFVLRSGKALGKNRQTIKVHFQDVPHLAFGQDEHPRHNVLRLELSPDRMHLDMNVNCPGDLFDLQPIDLDAQLAPQERTAYGTLLLDVLQGDPMLFIRDDEAVELWRIVEPILSGWTTNATTLHEYPAGSTVYTGMLLPVE